MSETGKGKRTLGIMYIPDPTRCMNAELAKNDLSFVGTTIFKDEYESMKGLTNCIHKRGNNWKMNANGKREIRVIMQEWVSSYKSNSILTWLNGLQLCVIIRFGRLELDNGRMSAFNVKIMAWSRFLGAILDPKSDKDAWHVFGASDCVIGGADMSISYL
jgi:hypothetical protein